MNTRVTTDQSKEGLSDERLMTLIERSSRVIGNPIALSIAESASTPPKADEYVRELYWPNQSSAEVRALTALRKKTGPAGTCNFKDGKTTFETLVRESGRPADFLLVFQPDNKPIKGLESFELAQVLTLGSSQTDCSYWPYLMRELRAQGVDGDILTTLDVTGSREDWPLTRERGFKHLAYRGIWNLGQAAIWNHQEDPELWHWSFGGFTSELVESGGSQNYSIIIGHKICHSEGSMPVLYHTMDIFHRVADNPTLLELVTLVHRIDLGGICEHSEGAMTYERRIQARDQDGRSYQHVEGSLIVPYLVGSRDGQVLALQRNWYNSPERIEACCHAFTEGECMPLVRMYVPLKPDCEEVVGPEVIGAQLGNLQGTLFKVAKPVNLELLAGKTFLKNPPREILDIL